jgi:hypothetical protein
MCMHAGSKRNLSQYKELVVHGTFPSTKNRQSTEPSPEKQRTGGQRNLYEYKEPVVHGTFPSIYK